MHVLLRQPLTSCPQVMAIIDSVEEAIPLLKNVGMLFLFLLMIYSIMGTQILAGAYRTRSASPPPNSCSVVA